MADLKKARVTLGNVPLAATQGIAWKFIGGVAPYMTTFAVHRSKWASLKTQIGQPLRLSIVDGRGNGTEVNQVYILHEAPSDSPYRVSFVVADKRFWWSYKLVARDYNMPRKTGNRTARAANVPIETQTVTDIYDYLAYSLKPPQQEKWTAKDTIEDVLEILEGEGTERGGFKIESFPIKDTSGGTNTGEFTVQGVTLRDPGDVALARVMSFVPGAEVYINANGQAIVFDAADLGASEQYFQNLPVSTYTGEKAAFVNRKKIRPKKVIVHYQREVELLLDYEDDYGATTSAQPISSEPYIENVIPTVDPVTTLNEYDPEVNAVVPKDVPPGTWVRADKLLEAWGDDAPDDSFPWTFDTIKRHWLKGDLEGVLGARGLDLDEDGNIAMRVQALRQHFRQTFRINRRYMERTRSLRAVRVGLLDPVTGARAPAAVWGQACIISSTKGKYMAARGTDDASRLAVFRNVNYLAPSIASGGSVIDTAPGPTRVNILDEELGIFRLEWITSPYGTIESFIPSLLQDEQNFCGVSVNRDMGQQDTKPMGAAMIVESGANGIFLCDTLEFSVLLTVVPAAPNNRNQFHQVEVDPGDVASIFRREFRIQGGDGPELEVYVPPGEATARFALSDDEVATDSIQDLFALRGDTAVGIEGDEIPGYVLINDDRFLSGHAASLGAELLANYADNLQGTVVTRVPNNGVKLVGNMGGSTVRVAAAPSAKVDAVSQFPGQQRSISRLAIMPESTRQVVLGILTFK